MSPLTRFSRRLSAAAKAFQSPGLVRNAKSYYGGYAPMYGTDLTTGSAAMWSKWGAASALLINHAVFACVTKRAETIVGLPYRVVDKESRKEISPKTDPLMRALSAYQRHYRNSFFQEWMYDRDVTGEVFIEPLRDPWTGRVAGLDILSTLNVTPQTVDTQTVAGYIYMAGTRSVTLPADALIYDRNTIARMTPIYGYSPLLVVIGDNTAGVMQASGKAMLAYFNNDGAPGTIVMPPSADDDFPPDKIENIRRLFQPIKHASGKYATAILPYFSNVMTLQQPDLMKWSELLASVEPKVYTAYRTPRSIAGDSDSTRYQASPSDRTNYDLMIASTADDIAGVINNAIAPLIYGTDEPEFEFEFETASLDHIDQEERQAARDAYEDGAITLNEYREVLGYEPVEGGDVYLKKTGTEYVTADAFKPTPEPVREQIAVQAPTPPQLPANVPDRAESEEVQAFGKFVQGKYYGKRAFVWNVIDDTTSKAIETEVSEAEPAAVKSIIADWSAAFMAEQGVTDYLTRSYADMPEPVYEHISAMTKLGFHSSVIKASTEKLYAGIIAGKRTTGTTRVRFDAAFNDLLRRAANDRIGKAVFIRNMSILLDRYCRQAFTDGFYDGGVYGYEPEDDDERWIFAHVDRQDGFIANFATKLFADDQLTAEELNEKPGAWWNGSVLPAYNEGLLRASRDGAGKWFRGPTSDHCPDCSRLDGKVYRFSAWKKLLGGTLPPCKATECGGFECQCEVIPTRDPVTKGRPPRLIGYSKSAEIEVHDHAHV